MDSEREVLIRNVYDVLPKMECGWCGYGNCRRFARAVVEGRASPSECRRDPLAVLKISNILASAVQSRGPQHGIRGVAVRPKPEAALTESIQQDIESLVEDVDAMLLRMESRHK